MPNNMRSTTFLRGVSVAVLLVVPAAFMLWLWKDAQRAPLYVLSGKLFQSTWWRGRAGYALDQPTIGKWYFWTTVFSGAWLVFAFFAVRIGKSCSCGVRRVCSILAAAAASLYLCILALPFTWTIQYIHAMGWTQRRLIALAWGLTGYFLIGTLTAMLVRQLLKNKKAIEQTPAGDAWKAAPEEQR